MLGGTDDYFQFVSPNDLAASQGHLGSPLGHELLLASFVRVVSDLVVLEEARRLGLGAS